MHVQDDGNYLACQSQLFFFKQNFFATFHSQIAIDENNTIMFSINSIIESSVAQGKSFFHLS